MNDIMQKDIEFFHGVELWTMSNLLQNQKLTWPSYSHATFFSLLTTLNIETIIQIGRGFIVTFSARSVSKFSRPVGSPPPDPYKVENTVHRFFCQYIHNYFNVIIQVLQAGRACWTGVLPSPPSSACSRTSLSCQIHTVILGTIWHKLMLWLRLYKNCHSR